MIQTDQLLDLHTLNTVHNSHCITISQVQKSKNEIYRPSKSINFDFDTYIAIGEKGRLIRHIFRLCLKQYIETNGACSHLAKTILKRGFDWFGVFAFEI